MSVVDASFDNPLRLEEKATMILAGGVANQGYQCGMLWGAALAAGAQAYQLLGSGPQAEAAAMIATQKLVASFGSRTKNEINCHEITEMNFQGENAVLPILKFLAKGGPIGCFRMAARYAPEVRKVINTALSEATFEAPSPPISCTALLAEKMGVSEKHVVMAAGLAGGIGFSGGACGALGAAIWVTGIDHTGEEIGLNITNSWASEVIESFLESSDYEFECAKIVGRKFDDVNDHANYLCNGGCSKIIETLAMK